MGEEEEFPEGYEDDELEDNYMIEDMIENDLMNMYRRMAEECTVEELKVYELCYKENVKLAESRMNDSLKWLNFREFASMVQVVEISKKERLAMVKEMKRGYPEDFVVYMETTPEQKKEMEAKAGRPSSKKYLLDYKHPLYKSHCLQLKTKLSCPIMAGGKPPVYPVDVTEGVEERKFKGVQKKRDNFAKYVIANYWPYTRRYAPKLPGPDGCEISFDWSGLCILIDYMSSAESSYIEKGRLSEIENLAFGTREHPEFGSLHKRLITQYRFSRSHELADKNLIDPFGKNAVGRVRQFDPDNQEDVDAVHMAETILADNHVRLGESAIEHAMKLYQKRQAFLQNFRTELSEFFGPYMTRVSATVQDTPLPVDNLNSLWKDNSMLPNLDEILTAISVDIDEDVPVAELPVADNDVEEREEEPPLPEHGTDAEEKTFEKALDDYAREGDEMIDEYLEEIFDQRGIVPNPKQREMLKLCAKHFIDKALSKQTDGPPNLQRREKPKPLRLLLLGGPGTGKTFCITNAAKLTKEPFIYGAVTGSAGANLKNGSTLCNIFFFNPSNATRNPTSRKSLEPLGQNNGAHRLRKLLMCFKDKNGILVVDEVSMMTSLYMIHSSERLDFVARDTENEEPSEFGFGDYDVILAGDWNQIPALGEAIPRNVFTYMVKPDEMKYLDQKLIKKSVELFMTFRQIELTENERAREDMPHKQRIEQLIDYRNEEPITDEMLNYFDGIRLTQDDVARNEAWVTESVCITAANIERLEINKMQGKLFAKIKKEVMIVWPLDHVITVNEGQSFTDQDDYLDFREQNPIMNGFFIRGAPCVLNENLKPEKELSNGTQGYMNALVFDKNEPLYNETMQKIRNAKCGDYVIIDLAPTHMIVDVKSQHGVRLKPAECLDPREIPPTREGYQSVPILLKMKSTKDTKIKNMVHNGRIFTLVNAKTPGVELLFACTFEKSQGKTIPYVILCIHSNVYMNLTLAKLYVAFTRVRKSEFMRVWPRKDLNLQRLKSLRHPPELILLKAAYDENGYFSKEKYMEAYRKRHLAGKPMPKKAAKKAGKIPPRRR